MSSLMAHGDIPCAAEMLAMGMAGTAIWWVKTHWRIWWRNRQLEALARHIAGQCDHTCHLCRYTPFTAPV